MMNSVRNQVGKMSRSQLCDALYSIESRCRQITTQKYDDLKTDADRAKYEMAEEFIFLIVSIKSEN